MKRTERITDFDRIVSALDGGAKPNFAFDMTNLRLVGRSLKFRWGYANVGAAPVSNFNGCRGLGWVRNESGAEEFISIEERPSGTLQPYSLTFTTPTPLTFARTQITTGVTSLSLAKPDWLVTAYGDYAYIINPEADLVTPTPAPTIYKHLIGTATDWSAVQDSAYQDPGDPIDLTTNFIVPNTLSAFIDPTTSLDTYSITNASAYHPGTITKTYNSDGSLLLNGPSNDTGGDNGGWLYIEQTFGAPIDFTGADYLFMNFQAESYMNFFTTVYAYTNPFQLKIGGVWVNVVDKKWSLSSDRRQATWMIYTKGMTLTAVQGIRFNISCKPGRGAPAGPSQNIVTISPLKYGGYYTESTSATQRTWDTNLVGDGVTYGARFSNGIATHSTIEEIAFSKAQITANTTGASYANYPGTKLQLISTAPSGAYDRVQFLRRDDSVSPPVWKIIDTKTTSPYTTIDTYREMDISTLATASVAVIGEQIPPFRTSGIVGAFPYKQCMVWLINSGTANLQFSEVGNPLSLYVDGVVYGTDPLQPAQFTMSDDEGDRPVWGTQAGMIAFIIGNKSAYAMFGDTPSTMSPSRQIPGSRGIVGRYAGTRWRPKGGQYSVAYMDQAGEVWSVSSAPQFVDDTRVVPIELSQPIRGLIKQRLLDEQLAEFPSLSLSQVQAEFDEELSALWFILGKRAAVFRQDESGVGWEIYTYTITSTGALAVCEDYAYAGATVTESGSGTSWTNLANAVNPDGTPASCTFGFNNSTVHSKYVYVTGFTPSTPIPATASITSLSFKIRDKKSGDLGVTNVHAHPTVNGTPLGSNLATNRAVTDSYFIQEFALSTLPTAAEVDAGNMGINIRYEQEYWQDNHWNNASHYTITLTGATSAVLGGTVTYTGPGSPPPFVYINLTSTVVGTNFCPSTCSPFTPPQDAIDATVNNGQGVISAGPLPTTNPSLTATNTVRYKVLLTAGVGSLPTVTRSATSVLLNGTNWVVQPTYSASAAYSTATSATVDLDDVEMKFCWSDPTTATTGVSFGRTAFNNGKNLAIRNSLIANNGGQVDAIEKNFTLANPTYVSGDTRDAGNTPPSWSWTSQNYTYAPNRSRISSVELHTVPLLPSAAVVSRTDSALTTVSGTRMSSASDWFRWPITTSGMVHQLTVTGPVQIDVLETLSFEFNIQSTGKARK